MKNLTSFLIKGMACVCAMLALGASRAIADDPSPVTAIDILLEPDATMLQHAAANNARLLKVYPKGFALDATHTPHITMLQCFVRTADLDKVYAAEEKVFAAANVNAMKLDAFKFYYIPAGGGWGSPAFARSRRRNSSSCRRTSLPPRSRSCWKPAPSARSPLGTMIPPSTRP